MMKSNFLNLPYSASGDARRHVPFKSIIHKPLSIIFVLVFVFSILFSYVHPVAALADPVFQPVYDTQFYQLPQFVDPLNSTQQDIFYFILGSQVVEYAGLSDYQIENPYSDPSSVGEWFKKIGIDLYNDVLESFAIAGAPVVAGAKWVKDLYANIAGAANFAGAFNNNSFNDFLNDVQTNGLSLQLYPVMFGSLNQYFANKNHLYNWQNKTDVFHSNTFVWETLPLGQYEQSYLNYVLNFNLPTIHFNVPHPFNGNYLKNCLASYPNINIGLFLNTSTGEFNIINCDNMTKLYNQNLNYIGVNYDPSNNRIYGVYQFSMNLNFYGTVQLNNFNNIVDAIQYIFDYRSFNNIYYDLSDLIKHVYIGTSLDNVVEVFNNSDLNFSENNNEDTLMPVIDTLLDIKGLISDILDQNELKQPALDNLTDLNGDPIPATQLQPVSVAVELPDSGITINSGLFTPLTKNGGYINYLWYMTKPLVQYTSDLVQTLVFPDDTGEGFDATGPGVIVFGVISLGLIGGLVVKCLL